MRLSGPELPSSPNHSGGARRKIEEKVKTSATQKRRARRKRKLQALRAAPDSRREDIRAAITALRGSSSRQRERSDGWKRRHPQIARRDCCHHAEAPEAQPSGQREETSGIAAQPAEAQVQKKKILSKLYSIEGPVPVKNWHKLDLGKPIMPPAHRQESEI